MQQVVTLVDRVGLEHDVFDVIAGVHDTLLHTGKKRRIVLLTRGITELLSMRFELLLYIKNKRLGFHSVCLHTLPKVHISAIAGWPCNFATDQNIYLVSA